MTKPSTRDYPLDHYAANWPHLNDCLAAIRRRGITTVEVCRTFGVDYSTFSVQKAQRRVPLDLLKAIVFRFDPASAQQLRDSVVVEHSAKGFRSTAGIQSAAHSFDVIHPEYAFVMKGGGFLRPAATPETPEVAQEPEAVVPVGLDAPTSNSDAGHLKSASPVQPTMPNVPASSELDAMILISAKLVRERDHYATQLAVQRTRFEQEKAELQAKLSEQADTIKRLEADVREWEQLSEVAPPVRELPTVSGETQAKLTLAVERAGLNGATRSLTDEIAHLPKAAGHGR